MQATEVPATKKALPQKVAVKGGKGKKRGAAGQNNNQKTETSADVQRKAEAARLEIARTKEQIKANDAEIKKNLASLSQIGADIDVSKREIAGISSKVSSLEEKMETYEANIIEREKRIAVMRERYRQALRKLRLKKGHTGTLSFIFSSQNFNQALRRIRYLKKYSEWRDRQTAEIQAEVEALRKEREQLGFAKNQHSEALVAQRKTQEKLEGQYNRQDALIANLKKNGQALNAHLARKQAEANDLRNRISSLIAAEQKAAAAKAKAEAEAEKKRREAARRAEERKLAEERKAAEERRIAEEKAKAAKEEMAQKQQPAPTKKPETQKPVNQVKKTEERTYADARRRQPRTDTKATKQSPAPAPAPSKVETPTNKVATTVAKTNGFASSKGNLPRPSSSGFRVVSRFGPHPLPDLPTVTYDNPGIDVEVSHGASALAVYPGSVTGVYVVKGFSTVIIVNHGEHYTVYGNLATTSVKKGDTVRQGQALGRVASDADEGNRSILHFEVWCGRSKLNPLEWIK